MSVSRTTIDRSAASIEWDGVTLYPEAEIPLDWQPNFEDIVAWAYGRVDECKKDFVIPFRCRLWGAFENLSVLFPSGTLTPVPGTSLCGDNPLILWGKNGNKITFPNAALTGLAGLYFGVDKNVWAADVEFTAIIQSGKNPEDSDAYFTRASASYSPAVAFAKTNFLRRRASLVWSGKTGFTSFEMREGVNIGWRYDVQADISANYGTDNLYIGPGGLIGELSGIPAVTGANLSNSDTGSLGQATNLGVLASSGAADLTVTLAGTGSHATVLKNAFLAKYSEVFDIRKLRPGEHIWRTTTGFSAGTPAAIATVA